MLKSSSSSKVRSWLNVIQQATYRPSSSVMLVRKYILPTRGLEEFRDDSEDVIGRAWKASELRQKSFSDLHKLWYVLLKEKNMLMTVRHECIKRQQEMPNYGRIRAVKLSMARVKHVVTEFAKRKAAERALKNWVEKGMEADPVATERLVRATSTRRELESRLRLQRNHDKLARKEAALLHKVGQQRRTVAANAGRRYMKKNDIQIVNDFTQPNHRGVRSPVPERQVQELTEEELERLLAEQDRYGDVPDDGMTSFQRMMLQMKLDDELEAKQRKEERREKLAKANKKGGKK